jgi:small-conductance mechanosensitive channel
MMMATAPLAAQQPKNDSNHFAESKALLDVIERDIVAGKPDESQLGEAIKRVSSIRTQNKNCVNSTATEFERVKAALATLGERAEGESGEITQGRKELQGDKERFESRLAQCNLLLTTSDVLLDRLTKLQQAQLTSRLIQKRADVYTLALDSLLNPWQWWDFGKNLAAEGVGVRYLNQAQIALLLVLAVVSIGFGFWLKREIMAHARTMPSDVFSAQLFQAFLTSLARYLPFLLLFGTFSLFMALVFHGVRPLPVIALLSYGLGAYALSLMSIRTLLYPPRPAKQVIPLPDALARAMARRLTVLALLTLLGLLLFATLLSKSLAANALDLARSVFMGLLVINLVWLIWLVGRIAALERSGRGVRILLLFLMIVVLAAEWLGYRALSLYLLFGLFATLGAIVLFWMVSTLFSEIFTGLDEGRGGWQRRLRRQLSLERDEPIPGLTAIRFSLGLLLWIVLGLALLRIWGLSDTGIAIIVEYLVDGFKIGTTEIVPSKVLSGLLIFALLLAATRWLKGTLEKRWIKRTRLDSGAREAAVTITGYVGFIIAFLMGLSMSGVDLKNITIIAGALSVGIGFGLQEIVKNFVSGIILLFERPIKTGDWVDVGTTQGWVKRIRVRATEVMTVDKTDVIVPNSQFIAAEVTNWTLRDPYGRIKVPVGVAYGSDVQLVKKLLLEVAQAHPKVLTDKADISPPRVFFMAFGDSALLFELRCFILDITRRWDIVSDLNFEIDRVFRENGVQIPFPQRDLHLRSGFSAETDRAVLDEIKQDAESIRAESHATEMPTENKRNP